MPLSIKNLRIHGIILVIIALVIPLLLSGQPVNAATPRSINEVGGVTGLDMEYAVPYSNHSKGEPVNHQWASTYNMNSIVTINAYINDLGFVNTGDMITIPVSYSGSKQYPVGCDLNKNLYSPEGELMFTVTAVNSVIDYISQCSSIVLKKVSTRNYGKFEFTLRSHWLADTVPSKSTDETVIIGGASYSFSHEIRPSWKLEECQNFNKHTKDKANYAYSGTANYSSESHSWFTIVQCGNVYRRVNGIDQDKNPGDLIAWARIDPSSSDTTVDFIYHELSWFHAFTELEPGSESGQKTNALNTGSVFSKRTDNPVITNRALAAKNLKPFEYAIEKQANGQWYFAVNYGQQYGQNVTNAHYTWTDKWTDNPLGDAKLAKLIVNAGKTFQRSVAIVKIDYKTMDENRTANVYYDMGDSIENYAKGSFTAQNTVVKNESQKLDSMVSFNNNAVDVTTTVDPVTGTPTSVIHLPAGLFRVGYTFVGWSEDKNGAGTIYQPGDEYTLPADSSVKVLYAVWKPNIQHSMPVTGSNEVMILLIMIMTVIIAMITALSMGKRKNKRSSMHRMPDRGL